MRIAKSCLSVRLPVFHYPEKINHPGFVNIINGKVSSCITTCKPPPPQKKKLFFKNDYLSVSAVVFVNNVKLILHTLIGAIILSINIQVGFNIYLC